MLVNGLVAEQSDVEQLVGVVQQPVVEADAGGERRDARDDEDRDDDSVGVRRSPMRARNC